MAPGLLTSEITINMLVSKEGTSCCPLIHNVTLHNIGKENSSHVREPGQSWILDSMLWIPDSSMLVEDGFWIPIVSGIPDSLSCIPDYKCWDFGFDNQNFR